MTPQETEAFGLHIVALDIATQHLTRASTDRNQSDWIKIIFLEAVAAAKQMTAMELQILVDRMADEMPEILD